MPFSDVRCITGKAVSPNGSVVPNCSFFLSNGDSVRSSNYGTFRFTGNKGGRYALWASKNNDTNRNNGISLTDLLLLQAHLLNKNPFTSPYQYFAADVNGDGKVSTLDLLYLKRFLLHIDTVFLGNRSWVFTDSAAVYPKSAPPFPVLDTLFIPSLTFNLANKVFIGVKLGDLNFDAKPEYAASSAMDTLSVYAYNILKYGDACQGPASFLDGYFRTIVQATAPSILSLEKVSAFSPADTNVATNLALRIRDSVLESQFPGRYAVCAVSNQSKADNLCILFYDKEKLGYMGTQTLVVNVTDFNMHKLYYKDANLPITGDTTFLYIVQNHDQSGNSSTVRDQQIAQEMKALRKKFAFFPNLLNLGDFNTRNTSEGCYQSIVGGTDSATNLLDPPFGIDKALSYPADWDNQPTAFAKYLSTSTRSTLKEPNACGTDGGAKSWYDHIFLSPWLASGSNYLQYVTNSYVTYGNDGNRVGADINAKSPVPNGSVPPTVADALFQMSNKYPVSIKLLASPNVKGYSKKDP